MSEALVRGVLAGYGIAIPVGAIAVLIINTGMQRGFLDGFAAGAGAATADFIYACVAVFGGGLLVPLLAPIAPVLRVLSGLVLIAIAVGGLMALRKRSAPTAAAPAGSIYARFLALTLVNPMTVVYFTALILGGSAIKPAAISLAAFAVGAFLASLSWQTILAGFGAWAHRGLPPSFRVATAAAGNAIVLALGLANLLRA